MANKIILEVPKPKEAHIGDVVKITRDARDALEALMLETGLSARRITSTLIVQGADIVEVREA